MYTSLIELHTIFTIKNLIAIIATHPHIKLLSNGKIIIQQ